MSIKCITRLILRVISDYVMALEYRDWATKPYNVKLVSQTIITKESQLCLQFRILLNRANQLYTFLVTIVSLKDPNLDNVVFQRYVAEADELLFKLGKRNDHSRCPQWSVDPTSL